MLFLIYTFSQVYAGFTHNSSTSQSQETSKVGKCLKLSAVLQRILRPIPKATIVWEQGLSHCERLSNLGNIITDLTFFKALDIHLKVFNNLNTQEKRSFTLQLSSNVLVYIRLRLRHLIAQERENTLNSMEFSRSFIRHKFYIMNTIFFPFKK